MTTNQENWTSLGRRHVDSVSAAASPVTYRRAVPSGEMSPDWRLRAACRDADPELFFPISEVAPSAARQIAKAKAVCAQCEVRAECLAFALASGQDAGIWGGLTAHERRAFKRQAKEQQRRG